MGEKLINRMETASYGEFLRTTQSGALFDSLISLIKLDLTTWCELYVFFNVGYLIFRGTGLCGTVLIERKKLKANFKCPRCVYCVVTIGKRQKWDTEQSREVLDGKLRPF